jgi:hypothetical protein
MDVYDMERALTHGYVDSIATWEPVSSMILNKRGEMHRLYQTSSFGFLYFSKKFYNNNPRLVKEILISYLRALHWMKVSPHNRKQIADVSLKKAQEFFGSTIHISSANLERLLVNDLLFLNPLALIPESVIVKGGPMCNILTFLKKQKILGDESTLRLLKGAFDLDALRLIIKERRKNKLHKFNYSI